MVCTVFEHEAQGLSFMANRTPYLSYVHLSGNMGDMLSESWSIVYKACSISMLMSVEW